MSMLTPPGMGGKYRITGNRYPRMRRPRHRRVVLAAIGATAAVALIGWGTLQVVGIFSGGGVEARAAAGAKNCAVGRQASASPAPKPKVLPEPAEITVNVYNATTRSGLAKKTAKALEKRGFTIGEVDNAPAAYDKKVKDSALLLGAPAAEKGAFDVLGAHLAGAKTKQDKSRKKPAEVDFMIGDAFGGLAPEDRAAETVTALVSPAPKPSARPAC
ncbi:LytR C-terminal domain-containing protein [Streptomyces sp. F63]|uniref:LytR C-terminal domain-containing protein n=1 Tax=Streptomyces sp. F63 TaxID=2824887 RepID=UPI001B372098|nr:LytR C-terminal domain-containing protein [Streptomyces sp. F63]MBQ0983361.1 LytR C-terminal domain-containing protein [Streptomyces sp. F63]